jgi:tripartite-type tricarboxylate transporter receptor subunit TctC
MRSADRHDHFQEERLMKARWLVPVLAVVMAVVPLAARAQAPVHIVVGGPPGGNTDIAARLASEKLSQVLGAPVVIENRPGAGGVVAAEFVKNAKPDGTVIGLVTASNTANETLMRNKSYSLTADLEPVGLYVWLANVLIVTPSIPAKSVSDLVTALKARAKNDYASGGIGSPGHLSGESFKLLTGVAMTHVPYKGAPPAVLSVITGETALMFATASAALPQIKGGKVQALAVTSQSRLAELPNVPTLAEAGLGNIDVRDWVGFVVPKGTPDAVKQRLHEAFSAAYGDAGIRQKLEQNTMLAAQPALGPAEFGAFLAKDVAKWAKTIEQANIKAE